MFSETSNRKGNLFKKLKSFTIKKKKYTPNRSNGDQYFYISNFEQTNDKECLEYDKLNQQIYLDNLKLFNETNNKLSNTPFKLTNNPNPPPRPNNYERLYLWKQRNIKLSVHDQSLAIVYLLSKRMRIKFPESKYDGFEPFNAIKIAENIALENDENMMKQVIDYLSNLVVNEEIDKKNNTNETNDTNETNNTNEINDTNDTNTLNNNFSSDMRCNHPEHHHIDDKINYYETHVNQRLYPVMNGYPNPGLPTAPPSEFKPPSYNDMDKLI